MDDLLYLEPVTATSLRSFVHDEPFGTLVHHPLVTTVLEDPDIVDDALRIIAWKQQEIRMAVDTGRWDRAIVLYEKPYRPEAISGFSDRMSDRDYWNLVAQTWMKTEYPHKQQNLWLELLTADRPGRYIYGMSDEDQEHFNLLDERVAVWRGAGSQSSALNGMSWTEDPEQAHWFAKRFNASGLGVVVSGQVRKTDILLILRSRGEHEVLCEPGTVET